MSKKAICLVMVLLYCFFISTKPIQASTDKKESSVVVTITEEKTKNSNQLLSESEKKKDKLLPKTGGERSLQITLIGIQVLLINIALLFYKGRNQGDYNEKN